MEKLKVMFTEIKVRLKWILLINVFIVVISNQLSGQSRFEVCKYGNYFETKVFKQSGDTCLTSTRLRPFVLEDSDLLYVDFELAHSLSCCFSLRVFRIDDNCNSKTLHQVVYGPKKEFGFSPRIIKIGKRNKRRFDLRIGEHQTLKLRYKDYYEWESKILTAFEEIKQEKKSSARKE